MWFVEGCWKELHLIFVSHIAFHCIAYLNGHEHAFISIQHCNMRDPHSNSILEILQLNLDCFYA